MFQSRMQGHPPPCWVQPAVHQKTQVARCSVPHFDLQFRHGNTSYTLPYIVMGASDMKKQELRGSTSTEGKGTSHGHLHLAEATGEHCQQQVPWVPLWGAGADSWTHLWQAVVSSWAAFIGQFQFCPWLYKFHTYVFDHPRDFESHPIKNLFALKSAIVNFLHLQLRNFCHTERDYILMFFSNFSYY